MQSKQFSKNRRNVYRRTYWFVWKVSLCNFTRLYEQKRAELSKKEWNKMRYKSIYVIATKEKVCQFIFFGWESNAITLISDTCFERYFQAPAVKHCVLSWILNHITFKKISTAVFLYFNLHRYNWSMGLVPMYEEDVQRRYVT